MHMWTCPSTISGPGPNAKPVNVDKHKRRMIQWYHPLNEIFSFDELPLKDLTKPERSSRPGDKLWWLTNENTKWDDTQNAWLKAPIHLLSAFPGILTTFNTCSIQRQACLETRNQAAPPAIRIYIQQRTGPCLGRWVKGCPTLSGS
jgi:hypothetical protein